MVSCRVEEQSTTPVVISPDETNGFQFVEVAFRRIQFTGALPFSEIIDIHQVVDFDTLLDDSWTIVCRTNLCKSGSLLAERNGEYVFARCLTVMTRIECAAGTSERAKSLTREISLRLPVTPTEVDDLTTGVRMWHRTRHGYTGTERSLRTTPWQAARQNYPAEVARSLDTLMGLNDLSPKAGRILLWHGAPGTGKTSAARALLHEWRGWCSGHIVIDPEHFFGDPLYITELISAGRPDRWKLIIAEDCDDYLVPTTGGVGGPLGQLLNLTDGLFGQGTDTLVLLTTNAPIERIHPAIKRPGRCLSTTTFGRLSPDEVARNTGSTASVSMTLAELHHFIGTGAIPATNDHNGGYA